MSNIKTHEYKGKLLTMKEVDKLPCKHRMTLKRKRQKMNEGMTIDEMLNWRPLTTQQSGARASKMSSWRTDRIHPGSWVFRDGKRVHANG